MSTPPGYWQGSLVLMNASYVPSTYASPRNRRHVVRTWSGACQRMVVNDNTSEHMLALQSIGRTFRGCRRLRTVNRRNVHIAGDVANRRCDRGDAVNPSNKVDAVLLVTRCWYGREVRDVTEL